MRPKGFFAWPLVLAVLASVSCSSSGFDAYRTHMFQGMQLYGDRDYGLARSSFMRASEVQRTPSSLAWSAASSYKMGDLETAEQLIREAQAADGQSVSSLRILGYRALILLQKKKSSEGLQALKEYLELYERLDPLMSVREIKRMVGTGNIDLARLETLIDEQVGQYESDIDQLYSTGTGYYGTKWETRFRGLQP